MPEIEPGVEDMIESPDEENEVHLILGVRDSGDENLLHALQSLGAEIESLPSNHLAITTDEADVRDICRLEGIESVEVDTKATTLSQDFLSPLG